MNIDRSFKIGVTSSVIATILDPVLRFGTFLLTHAFGTWARGYVDRLFERAALLTGPDTGLQVLAVILGLITGLLSGGTVGVVAAVASRARRASAEAPRAETPRWIARWLSPVRACVIIILINALLILQVLMLLHSTMFQVRVTSRFNQHLAAIAPYVADREVKVLRSRWTQMTSERDYQAIYTDLNRIAAANSVRLPCGPDLLAFPRSCR